MRSLSSTSQAPSDPTTPANRRRSRPPRRAHGELFGSNSMPKAARSHTKRAGSFDQANLEAAQIILADIERAGGAEALPVIWAHRILSIAQSEGRA